MTNYKFNERGQVALIVLLVSAIVLSLGLSISRKTTVETKVDTDEELLKKAFNTAESSIDKYLVTGETTYNGGAGESATVVSVPIGVGKSMASEILTQAQAAFFWLVEHNANGTIDLATKSGSEVISVCGGGSFVGGLKIDNFYYDGANYRVNRTGVNIGGNLVNGFTNVPSGKCTNVSTMGGSLLLTVTPIFDTGSSTVITAEKSVGTFPEQGEDLTATGKVGDQTTGVSRKVRVRKGYKVPVFMLDALTTL